jgi:hypothetical protein
VSARWTGSPSTSNRNNTLSYTPAGGAAVYALGVERTARLTNGSIRSIGAGKMRDVEVVPVVRISVPDTHPN